MSISAIDGNYDGKVTIRKGQGISQAIRDELGLTQEQCNALGKEGWENIFEEVKKNSTKAYTGGEDLFGDPKQNYKVKLGQEIQFDQNIWNNIVDIVNEKLSLSVDHVGETPVEEEEPAPVQKEEETTETQEEETPEPPAEPARLTAGDWFTSLGKSAGKFIKNIFCKEDGTLSAGKTGLAVATTVAAAVLCTNPIGAAIVGVVGAVAGGALAVKGTAGIIRGAQGIKAATTREAKLDALEETTDGIVETTVGVGMAVSGAKMAKKGFAGIKASRAVAQTETPALPAHEEQLALPAHEEQLALPPHEEQLALPAHTETPAPAGTKALPAHTETPALPAHTETPVAPKASAREMSITNRRAIAETGTTNPNTPATTQPSMTSKYNPAPENPTQVTRVHQTGSTNPGTFADAKGGDQLAQLRSQVAAEEAAAQSSSQGQAAARLSRAQENLTNMRKGTENNPLTPKETGKKIKAIREVEHAQSAAATVRANRTVTRFSTHSNAEVSYVFKNNNLVEVRIPQGNGKAPLVLTKPVSIQQHLIKNGINEAELI